MNTFEPIQLDNELSLQRDEHGLFLVSGDQILRGDFTKMLPRIKASNIPREFLVKAAKIKDADHPLMAIDATAGLGEDSLLLAAAGFHVTLFERNPVIAQLLADALAQKDNVNVIFSTVVTGYETENGTLTGLQLRNEETGEASRIAVDGAFLAVGLQPENDAFAPLAQLDDRGYFDTDEFCVTKTAGLFVAGDCRRKQIRQVTTAAADGAVAAMAACRYLEQ